MIENIVKIFDKGSLIELSKDIESNISIGYGTINEKLVYFISENKNIININQLDKIKKIYNLAMSVGAPIIFDIDNNGVDLNNPLENLYLYGDIYKLQSKASGMILQIGIISGVCAGGMATVASGFDFLFIDEDNGKIFTLPPITIGENTNNDSSKAKYVKNSLLIDGSYKIDDLIIYIKKIIEILPSNYIDNDSYDECNDDLNRKTNNILNLDNFNFVKEISDNNNIYEIKSNYSKSVFTGFIKLNGQTIGVVANQNNEKYLCKNGIKKIIKFIKFLDSFSIPLLTITDIKKFNIKNNDDQDISIDAFNLSYAYVNSTIPKVTIIKNAIGIPGIILGSKSLNVDIVYAYNNSVISPFDKSVFIELKNDNNDNNYETIFSGNNLIKNNIIDCIINEEDTRQMLISAFEMLFTKKIKKLEKKHGAF